MPLPSYMRFPSSDSSPSSFFGLKPRNPTCGVVSLETGAKFFTWANIIVYGSIIVLLIIGIVMVFIEYFQKKTELTQKYPVIIAIVMIILFLAIYLFYQNWKMRRAIIDRDVLVLKSIFLIIFFFDIFFLSLVDIEGIIIMSTKSMFFDVPMIIFRVFGTIFTYSFIVSLVNPSDSDAQNGNMNRIEFSV